MTPGRRSLIAGNWKMHYNHLEAIAHTQKVAYSLTAKELEAVEVVVLAPFVDLRSVQTLVEADKLAVGYGAQDVSAHAAGAYTGEVSGPMLAKLGCRYVVVGHSERRRWHGETGELVAAKVRAAFAAGLTPIVCVGEPAEVRHAGGHVDHVLGQLAEAVGPVERDRAERLVVAYEPVWAIGTGQVAGPSEAQEMAAALRARLAELHGAPAAAGARLLYGGSVTAGNAADLLGCPDVDGALVGGASLDAAEFAAIARAAL